MGKNEEIGKMKNETSLTKDIIRVYQPCFHFFTFVHINSGKVFRILRMTLRPDKISFLCSCDRSMQINCDLFCAFNPGFHDVGHAPKNFYENKLKKTKLRARIKLKRIQMMTKQLFICGLTEGLTLTYVWNLF